MGICSRIFRSTLSDANDCRIWADFAQSLIGEARDLSVYDSFGAELKQTTYVFDFTSGQWCQAPF